MSKTAFDHPRRPWLPFSRSRTNAARGVLGRASPPARQGMFARVFGGRAARQPVPPTDASLALVRDWIFGRGGRIDRVDTDLVAATLPDSSVIRYTTSARRAQADPGATLIGPGTPALDALVADISGLAEARALIVPAPPSASADAAALARAAFAPAVAGCGRCALPDAEPALRCADCPLRRGRVVVAGVARHGSTAQVMRRWDRAEAEFLFSLATTSIQGRREEVVRIGVVRDTGARTAPLDEGLLARAHVAAPPRTTAGGESVRGPSDGAEADRTPNLATARRNAEASLHGAALAAARLARAATLPEYHERQAHVTSMYARLLVEAPENARDTLVALESELARLADAYAVRLETTPLAQVALKVAHANVDITFPGGGTAAVEVDLARHVVASPTCPACARFWRVGARCAEGHVTCASCQQVCAHCGARRCARCAAHAYVPCNGCGALACSRCGRRRCKSGRGIARSAPVMGMPLHAAAGGDSLDRVSPVETVEGDDLTVDDLDYMTPETWSACCRWILDGLGYAIERELNAGGASPRVPDIPATRRMAWLCRAVGSSPSGLGLADVLGPSRPTLLVAKAYRPSDDGPGAAEDVDALDNAVREARTTTTTTVGVSGARPLLLTTARLGTAPPTGAAGTGPGDLIIVDRTALGRLLRDRVTAYQRTLAASAAVTERRARAADQVRASIHVGLEAVRAEMALAASEDFARDFADGESLVAQARTAQQALLALETLLDEWEAGFGSDPSRDGSMAMLLESEEYHALSTRAAHLFRVLRVSARVLGAAPGSMAWIFADWREAVREELLGRCDALNYRCQALEPLAWRAFAAAHHTEQAELGARARERARRAGARARQQLDAIRAREQAAMPRVRAEPGD